MIDFKNSKMFIEKVQPLIEEIVKDTHGK